MAVYRLFKNKAFEPEAIATMTDAYEMTALLGEFSIIRQRFHAGTTRPCAAPFRKQMWHAGGTFRRPLAVPFRQNMT